MPVEVLIVVEGGIVQSVEAPQGVRVVVRDYDVDTDDENTQEDNNGDRYTVDVRYGKATPIPAIELLRQIDRRMSQFDPSTVKQPNRLEAFFPDLFNRLRMIVADMK